MFLSSIEKPLKLPHRRNGVLQIWLVQYQLCVLAFSIVLTIPADLIPHIISDTAESSPERNMP